MLFVDKIKRYLANLNYTRFSQFGRSMHILIYSVLNREKTWVMEEPIPATASSVKYLARYVTKRLFMMTYQ
jgi:hypothetical protein